MRRTTVAYVDSSRDRTKRYIVIKRGNRFECSCLDFFFKEDRDEACKHIRQVLKTEVKVEPGKTTSVTKLACVELSRQGVQLVHEYHTRRAREAQKVADPESTP